MFKNQYFEPRKLSIIFSGVLLSFLITSIEVSGQVNSRSIALECDCSNWWMTILFILVGCLAFAVYFRHKLKGLETIATASNSTRISYSGNKSGEENRKKRNSDWLEKNGTSGNQKVNRLLDGDIHENGSSPITFSIDSIGNVSAVLPIYTFLKLEPTAQITPLPISNDEALLSAIEQVREEFEEEDEKIRALAVRVLAAFRTSNSVEALSQVALYDLSSNLRSAAVTTLSEFDHESVFETILLACADPTREVRAAAARALFHLSFDRSEAWARIANLRQQGRLIQMARAAIEADLVERSFERLIHQDRKYSYEAFALVTLLVRAGEIEVIADFLKRTKDANLRRAILHTIKVSKNKHGLEALKSILMQKNLSPGVQEDCDKTVEEMGFVIG